AELAAEVRVLLVGEGLERRGVRDAAAAGEGSVDGELRHQRLAGAGGRGDDDGLVVADGADGVELEGIQGEGVPGLEGLQQIVRHVPASLHCNRHLSTVLRRREIPLRLWGRMKTIGS